MAKGSVSLNTKNAGGKSVKKGGIAMSKAKTAAKCGKILVVLSLCASLGVSTIGANAQMMAGQGNYYSDFSSIEELQDAAADLGQQIAEEGMTLLKNKDGALPLEGNEWVSVFGVTADSLVGGSETVADALEKTGFRVNQSLVEYYAANAPASSGGMGPMAGNSEIGNEKTEKDFTNLVKSSLNLYNDLGVIVISRDGAEGSDLKMKTDEAEDNDYKGEDQGWKHKDLYTETTGEGDAQKTTEYKHYLQLTESEEDLIKYVESVCDKVVVVLNTSNVLESKNLQNDDEIDGIIWMGRTGDNGLTALGKILNGTVSPSGRTVDVWTADHTADPTWVNYATGEQLDDVTIGGEGADAVGRGGGAVAAGGALRGAAVGDDLAVELESQRHLPLLRRARGAARGARNAHGGDKGWRHALARSVDAGAQCVARPDD